LKKSQDFWIYLNLLNSKTRFWQIKSKEAKILVLSVFGLKIRILNSSSKNFKFCPKFWKLEQCPT
jgi:hypothetical protein